MTQTELATTERVDPRHKCGTCGWLAERTDVERETFEWMLTQVKRPGREWTLNRVFQEIKSEGYPLQLAALNRCLLGYYGCAVR